MFGFFRSKGKDAEPDDEELLKLDQAIDALENGNEDVLPVLYQKLASENEVIIKKLAAALSRYMQELDHHGIIRINDNFRKESNVYMSNSSGIIERWKRFLPFEEYIWCLRLGTFHQSGYFRARCICELEGDPGSVRFIILRFNDWAHVVRETAQNMLIPRMSADEMISCIPYLAKIDRGYRKNDSAVKAFKDHLVKELREQVSFFGRSVIGKFDSDIRRLFYYLMLERKILTKDEVKNILIFEKNGQCQRYIMAFFMSGYDLTMEEVEQYIGHRSTLIRRIAIEQKYKLLGDSWEGLDKELLSRSASIRETSRYILRKHTDIDVREYYKSRLDTKYRDVCILGIGECRNEDDIDLIKSYLDSGNETTVKCALHALGLIMEEKAKDIFWTYLNDPRKAISIQAYREILAYHIRLGAENVYNFFEQAKDEDFRERAACLLIREKYWDRLRYILMLYSYEDDQVRNVVRRHFRHKAMYSLTDVDEAAKIRSVLYDPKYQIPDRIKEHVEAQLRG